jgi:hypothetical protein
MKLEHLALILFEYFALLEEPPSLGGYGHCGVESANP